MLNNIGVHQSVNGHINAFSIKYMEKFSRRNCMSFLQNVLQKEKEKGEKEGGERERENVCLFSWSEQQVWILMKWNQNPQCALNWSETEKYNRLVTKQEMP